MTRITPNAFIMTSDGRSPSVRISELARHVCSDTDPDLVLAPSHFWKVNFQTRLETLLKDEDKFPGDAYTCEETIVKISVERSRQRGLKENLIWKQ